MFNAFMRMLLHTAVGFNRWCTCRNLSCDPQVNQL